MILEKTGIETINKAVPAKTAYVFSLLSEVFYKIFKINKEPRLTRFLVHELSKSHWFNINSARNLLDYCPEISNRESIKRTIDWLQRK